MNQKQKSLKNLFYSILGQVVTIGFGLLLPRLFIVGYGSEVNGLLNSLNQLIIYLELLEAGISGATLQALYRPVALKDWDSINGVLSATNYYFHRVGRIYLAVLIGLSLLYPLLVAGELPYATVCGAVFFSGLSKAVFLYFQGKYFFFLYVDGKNYLLVNLATIATVVTSLVKVVLISSGVNIVLILAAASAIQCTQTVYILRYIRRNYPCLRLDVSPNYQAIAQRNYAMGHQIGSLVLNNTDVLILTIVCDLRVVSVYSLYKLITSNLESLLSILNSAVSFVLGQNYQTDRALFTRRIDLFESFYSATLYALFSVALFLILPFMRLYTAGISDINYVDGTVAALFIAVSLLNQSRMPMLQTINYAGHYQQTLSRCIAETTINLSVSLLLVFPLGIYGVLIGTVAALGYRSVDILLYANHRLLKRSAKRSFAVYGVNIAIFLAMWQILPRLFVGLPITSWLQFVKVGCLSTALCLPVFLTAQLIFPSCRRALIALLRRQSL